MGFWKNLRYAHVALIHVLVWGILFGIPLIYGLENDAVFRFARRNCVMLVGLMMTFYGNLLWAIDKLLFKKKYLLFVLFNILLFLLVSLVRGWLNDVLDLYDAVPRRRGHDVGLHTLFIFNDIIFSILAICASLGLRHFVSLHKMEIERKKIENEALASELRLLRYQIRPHFFFNCLNNIYALIGTSPSDAQKAVHSLSKMMRFILYDGSGQTVSLSQEVEFLRNYVALMKLRLRGDAKVFFSLPSPSVDVEIPSLLFIPLVENAFKHGLGPRGEVDMRCEMKVSDGMLDFCIENSVFHAGLGVDNAHHSGIGLANLRKRLDLIYGDKFLFQAGVEDDGRSFRAVVHIPLTLLAIDDKQTRP